MGIRCGRDGEALRGKEIYGVGAGTVLVINERGRLAAGMRRFGPNNSDVRSGTGGPASPLD
jgi:hypothetical protein